MTYVSQLDTTMLDVAKWAFTTRRVRRGDVRSLSQDLSRAKAGDLVLCRIAQIGQHKSIQLADRRCSASYPGDLVVLCVGDSYAPEQFHARAVLGESFVHLAAGGGVVGFVEQAHQFMSKPTQLIPLALLVDGRGDVMNIDSYALPEIAPNEDVTVIGVFGASMNSGKTTAACSLAHGLRAAGYVVAGVKATGTGAFGDFNAFSDAGLPITDFTDAGMATTYRQPMERIERGFHTLVATAAARGAEVVVAEFADGVFQQETRAILEGGSIKSRLDGILFAAPDALGALGSVVVMERNGLAPFAISGMVSCSPLAAREAAEVTGLPILTREQLWNPETITKYVEPLMREDKEQSAA